MVPLRPPYNTAITISPPAFSQDSLFASHCFDPPSLPFHQLPQRPGSELLCKDSSRLNCNSRSSCLNYLKFAPLDRLDLVPTSDSLPILKMFVLLHLLLRVTHICGCTCFNFAYTCLDAIWLPSRGKEISWHRTMEVNVMWSLWTQT